MLQSAKINCFIELGKFLSQFSEAQNVKNSTVLNNDLFYDDFIDLIALSQSHNGWFTSQQVYFSIQSWATALTEQNVLQWISNYNFSNTKSKTVSIILAGNIPLVGFHDFLCVLLSGHKVVAKTSSNDQKLLPFIAKYLVSINTDLSNFIEFADGKLQNFDAVIATGSNNTARYFEYYFKSKQSIIRKNRNSVAVLSGLESKVDLKNLGEDLFRYFGLGCRNVSKLFVPRNYNFDSFFEAIFDFKDCIEYEKYANNYDYNKAVFLMSNYKLLDNGFLIVKEDVSYASPIAAVFFEYYDDLQDVKTKIEIDKDKIQCVVSKLALANAIDFGRTQQPNLWDYADNVDTLDWLISV